MASIKKYAKDELLDNVKDDVSVVQTEISGAFTRIAEIEPGAIEDLNFVSNIPDVDEATGASIYDIGMNADGTAIEFEINPDFAALFTDNSIVVVHHWNIDNPVNIPDADPCASLNALYVLALPNSRAMLKNPKLANYMQSLIERDTLSKARGLARKHYNGEDAASIASDPIAAFLSATASTAGREAAWKKMFPLLQRKILLRAETQVKECREAGNHQRAREINSVFSRARLSREMLGACLRSQETANLYFPTMTNNAADRGKEGIVWDNMLKMLITQAPNFKRAVAVKDAEGNNVKEVGADGKERVVKEAKNDPQSPAIFASWLETRYDTVADADDDVSMVDFMADFGGGLSKGNVETPNVESEGEANNAEAP